MMKDIKLYYHNINSNIQRIIQLRNNSWKAYSLYPVLTCVTLIL